MEETIEIVERMIENCKEHFELYGEAFVDKGEIKAIDHLIKAYKEIKEKLEDLKKQYKIALEENSIKAFILKCQIEILKELLEDK